MLARTKTSLMALGFATTPFSLEVISLTVCLPNLHDAHKRDAPFQEEPGYYRPANLWLYGNVKLFEGNLAFVAPAAGPDTHTSKELDEIERYAESVVLDGKILVCGVHNAANRRAACVPLRWGSPRIVCMSGGFKYHLGETLNLEPFRAARLWRYAWDPLTDLAVSWRAPDKKPTFASHNPTVDRLIARIALGERVGVLSPLNSRQPFLG